LPPVNGQDIIENLKYSLDYARILANTERDKLIISLCESFEINVSEAEIQESGDIFRKHSGLRGADETLRWLEAQGITPEDWAKGIYISLMTTKLKEHVCSAEADNYYLGNREACKRVAISQILVSEQATAVKIAYSLRENQSQFCALALEHSRGKQSAENGGFAGVRLVAELLPEIAQAVTGANEGEILGPIQSKMGYHVLRIEKWFPPEFNQVKDQLLDYLFQSWLTEHLNG
jgi:PPIC-type PPIASE domain